MIQLKNQYPCAPFSREHRHLRGHPVAAVRITLLEDLMPQPLREPTEREWRFLAGGSLSKPK